FSRGAWCRHPTVGSVTLSLVTSVVAPECVVPRPRGVSEVQDGSACGPSTLWRSEVVMPVVRRCFSHGCAVYLVVTPGCSFLTSWRSEMLVLVSRDSGLTWLLRCSMSFFVSPSVCAEGCFRIVFDSAGSARLVSGPTLVVGRGITLFHCFVVLCNLCFLALLLSRVVCLRFRWSSCYSDW
ncbi:hypothetical protein Taro_016624, partial [Colocasia esculenta]|nr:hypothetical protein [Colocasia esculenta]